MRVPPLAVALGIYLPSGTMTTVVFGAVAGWAYDKWVEKGPHPDMAKRLGVILASGLIVGESLFSVALAGAIAAAKTGMIKVSDTDFPIGLVSDSFGPIAMPLAFVSFLAGTYGLYRWTRSLARES